MAKLLFFQFVLLLAGCAHETESDSQGAVQPTPTPEPQSVGLETLFPGLDNSDLDNPFLSFGNEDKHLISCYREYERAPDEGGGNGRTYRNTEESIVLDGQTLRVGGRIMPLWKNFTTARGVHEYCDSRNSKLVTNRQLGCSIWDSKYHYSTPSSELKVKLGSLKPDKIRHDGGDHGHGCTFTVKRTHVPEKLDLGKWYPVFGQVASKKVIEKIWFDGELTEMYYLDKILREHDLQFHMLVETRNRGCTNLGKNMETLSGYEACETLTEPFSVFGLIKASDQFGKGVTSTPDFRKVLLPEFLKEDWEVGHRRRFEQDTVKYFRAVIKFSEINEDDN